MNHWGPVCIIEDDADDRDLIAEVYHSLQYPNEIKFFADGERFLQHMRTTTDEPFMVLCDISMPKFNGMELSRIINSDAALRARCTPFILLTTSMYHLHIQEALAGLCHGYFNKPYSFDGLSDLLRTILHYWKTVTNLETSLT